jgi:hypothetical protein
MMFILTESQKDHISDEFPYNRENSLYQIIIHVRVWFMYNYQHQFNTYVVFFIVVKYLR